MLRLMSFTKLSTGVRVYLFRKENVRRKQNYVPFAVTLLSMLADKVSGKSFLNVLVEVYLERFFDQLFSHEGNSPLFYNYRLQLRG